MSPAISMRALLIPPAVCLGALCSCGGGNESGATPMAPLDGTWNATGQVVGSGIALTLAESNSAVSGNGAYRIEASAPGAITITGMHTGSQVDLTLTYSNGRSAS